MSIVLDRDELRMFYGIMDDNIDAYRVSRGDKSMFYSLLGDMRNCYNSSRADEFVLIFKGVEIYALANILSGHSHPMSKKIISNIDKFFSTTKRFDNRVHHAALSTATNFMFY